MSLLAEDLTADEQALLAAQTPRYSKHELAQVAARRAAGEFIEVTPGFFPSESNLRLLCDWMIRMELEPTIDSFEKAYAVLESVLDPAPEPDPNAPKPVTASDIDRMSSEDFKQRLKQDKAFAAQVEAFGAAEPSRWGMSRKRF